MKLAAVIIAGGRSSRMGREKLLLEIGGAAMIDRIRAVLPLDVAINANGDASRFGDLGLPVIGDAIRDVRTPLAGIHAALKWAATTHDAVLTVPSDCPFLPGDLLPKLAAAGAPAIAASGQEMHYLTGLWPVGLLPHLEDALGRGMRRAKDWAALAGAKAVTWSVTPFDPFMNINRPEDLAAAESLAASQGWLPGSPAR